LIWTQRLKWGTLTALYKETHGTSVPKNRVEKVLDDTRSTQKLKTNHMREVLKRIQNALFLNQNNQ